MNARNSLTGMKRTAYSKPMINSPYTQAMERSPMDHSFTPPLVYYASPPAYFPYPITVFYPVCS